MAKRKTGEDLRRAYGIRLSMPYSMYDVFVNPVSYVIGQFMLETRSEKQARTRDWAKRHDVPYLDARDMLWNGVNKREGSSDVLTHSRNPVRQGTHPVLRNMLHPGGKFRAEVKSKGNRIINEGYYVVHLKEPTDERDINIGYPGSYSDSLDYFYSEEKGKDLTVMGIHMAIAEIALHNDSIFGWSQESNITRLSPMEREMEHPLPELPFTFTKFTDNYEENLRRLNFHQFITDLIFDYYVNKKSQYEISVRLANEPRLFGTGLRNAVRDPNDRARFQILRQMERRVTPRNIKEDTDYASARALMKRVERVILDSGQGYHFTGYMREFPASDPTNLNESFETVAKRFEPTRKGPVYSLSMVDGIPIIVKRNLEHKVDDLSTHDGELADLHPFKRVGIESITIDDVTRKEARTKVVTPDKTLMGRQIFAAQNLRDAYEAISAGTFN